MGVGLKESRLSLALRIQNLMKIHRHTLASIDPCTQIHTSPTPHLLTCWFSHTLACACVSTIHRQAHSLHTPTHPYTHHSIHMCIPPQLPTHTPSQGLPHPAYSHTLIHIPSTLFITHMPLNTFLHTYTPFHSHIHPPLPTVFYTAPLRTFLCTHMIFS